MPLPREGLNLSRRKTEYALESKEKSSLTFCFGLPSPVNRIRCWSPSRALSVVVSSFLHHLLLLLLPFLLLLRQSSGAFRRTTPTTGLSRTAATMMSVEEAEDPVPGETMEIHDDHTGKSRRGRIEPVAHTHTT